MFSIFSSNSENASFIFKQKLAIKFRTFLSLSFVQNDIKHSPYCVYSLETEFNHGFKDHHRFICY